MFDKNGKRKVKKPTRKSLVRRLDNVYSMFIRRRDDYKCFVCGKREPPSTVGHLFSRTHYSTRWDERNHCQCFGCNYRHEFEFEHYRGKWEKTYGTDAYRRFWEDHNKIVKLSDSDLQERIDYFLSKNKEIDATQERF